MTIRQQGDGAHPARRRPAPRPRPAGVLRSLLFGAAMFSVTALAGWLLASAAPAGYDLAARTTPAAGEATRVPPGADAVAAERAFAYSMVSSGATALALSVAGLVMVGRRRRLW